MAKADITAERLRSLVSYDPKTGLFTRLVTINTRSKAGSIAGCLDKSTGYIRFNLDGCLYYAHRLAWLYVHGVFPTHHIDHRNGKRADNRMRNLRDVPRHVNSENRKRANKGSKTGLLGVSRNSGGSWAAVICVRGTVMKLGSHKTKHLAHAAYLEAKRRLHEGCTI